MNSPNVLLILALAAAVFVVLLGLNSRSRSSRRSQASDAWSPRETPVRLEYSAKRYLLSPAERSFFETLRTAVAGEYYVFPQVSLSSLLYVSNSAGNPQSLRNKIQSKYMDFVLCSVQSVSPVLAIELDDASHQDDRRHARDVFMDEAFASAALPLVHVRAASAYNLRELRDLIASSVKR